MMTTKYVSADGKERVKKDGFILTVLIGVEGETGNCCIQNLISDDREALETTASEMLMIEVSECLKRGYKLITCSFGREGEHNWLSYINTIGKRVDMSFDITIGQFLNEYKELEKEG